MDREQDIPFIYEDGVLKPEGRVDLKPGTRGVARVIDTSIDRDRSRRAIEAIRRIAASGVFNSGGERLTRDQMHERR